MQTLSEDDVQRYISLGLFHSVHTSGRKAFRACRRRWDWSYRQGFHPTTTPKNLEFGIAYHTAMETWYEPAAWNKDRDLQSRKAVSAFVLNCQNQLSEFIRLNGPASDEVMADYRERVELGTSMVEYYTRRVSPKLDKGLTPLQVEYPFEVPTGKFCKCDACWKLWLEHKESNKYKLDSIYKNYFTTDDRIEYFRGYQWFGLPVTFGGRIDAIFQDEHERVLVFDWKTAARLLDDVDEAAFLELDDQVGGYPVALHRLGHRVDGFIYHEQKKAVPGEPKELKRAYKNKMFSTARDEPVEYETFLNTIMQKDLRAYNMGFYDEYLAYLQSPMKPKFYQRNTVYKTQTQMDNFWNDLLLEIDDMLDDPRIYPQASRFSCNSCLYRQPCEGKNRGEDYLYTLESMYVRG